ncbi:hypothetical protein ACHHYP_00898 [Achlya hypogyna]|uniref:Uncharacterized protein n=1 Tax=Achlya hypogyna TaxID=1202772 RepID=A0A1V9ZAA0_ACHHY|nr:hypothetical protein ACHHYP_00898 [Achlya hypogyna]
MERVQVYLTVALDGSAVQKLFGALGFPRGSWYRVLSVDVLADKTTQVVVSANTEASRFLCSRFQKGVKHIFASQVVVVRAQKFVALPPSMLKVLPPTAHESYLDRDYVVSLLDILGDEIVAVREQYEHHMESGQVSVEGMVRILGGASSVALVERMLRDMTLTNTVALSGPPRSPSVPCLAFNDVLSVYVMYHRHYVR